MKNYKLANLSDMLMAYREVEGSMSRTGVNPFLPNLIKISSENIAWATGRSADSAEVIALAKLHHGDYENISQKISFSKMIDVLNLAVLNIAENADTNPQQLDIALAWCIKRLRYHYFNYLCGGLLGKMMNSQAGRYIKKIVMRNL
jgi:hypothetical protein